MLIFLGANTERETSVQDTHQALLSESMHLEGIQDFQLQQPRYHYPICYDHILFQTGDWHWCRLCWLGIKALFFNLAALWALFSAFALPSHCRRWDICPSLYLSIICHQRGQWLLPLKINWRLIIPNFHFFPRLSHELI